MSASAPDRLAWADALKGMLIIGVVFWHVVLKSYLQVDWHIGVPIPGAWGLVNDAMWPMLLPLFFVVSGAFAAEALDRTWARVWRPRIARFLYLYVLWTLIHTITLFAFPEFPTLVPRSVAAFVEAVTVSPPNTWYVYALALYFLVAKSLKRVPKWLLLGAASALSVAVAAGAIEIVSNRGSLLYNLSFFLLGAFAARRIRDAMRLARPRLALGLVASYTAAFALVRVTDSGTVPFVWPALSFLGVAAVLALTPSIANMPKLGASLAWLGRRTLPIYLIHMPILVLIDVALVERVSDAPRTVQLIAAVVLPMVITGAVIAASAWLGGWADRDGRHWLFDLPDVQRARRTRPPWRQIGVVATLVLASALVASAVSVPHAPVPAEERPAARYGEVSIGAAGDVLLYDANRGVPADRGAGALDGVRDWMTEDLVTANLEQAITADNGYVKCARRSACFAFRSEPDAAPALAGFDLMNLANNHSRDYGDAGATATRAALAAEGIGSVGDRDEIQVLRIGDVRVAVVSFAPYAAFNRVTNLRRVERLVRAADARADLVLVHAHMGAEGPDADAVRPGTERMFGEDRGDVVAFSHRAIDAGADLIVGHGPHVVRGIEVYQGRLIAYSLGNLSGGGVFGEEPETRPGAYLSVRLDRDGAFLAGTVRSVRFDAAGGRPEPDPNHTAARRIAERSVRDFAGRGVTVAAEGTITLPAAIRDAP